MITCGVWRAAHHLVAVIVDDDDRARPAITSPATTENARHLLDYLATAGVTTLILSDRHHHLIIESTNLPKEIRLVPHELIGGLREATHLARRPAHHTASLLARLPAIALLRLHLRPYLPPPPNREQLPLF